MSLKKKITLSFFISAFIIAALSAFEYISFIEIRKEIKFLELTDTIRSKSLQLRRHEKNFFLYGPVTSGTEAEAIHTYITELGSILTENISMDKTGKPSLLKNSVVEYGERFKKIETSIQELSKELKNRPFIHQRYSKLLPLMEIAMFERPLQGIEFLEEELLMSPQDAIIGQLRSLDADINALRKNGEEIIAISKEIDRIARESAEGVTRTSKIAILIFFPLFLITGIGMLFLISRSVANRLNQLISLVEKTGKGHFSTMPVPLQKDEVGILIRKFNEMEEQLAQREAELEKKNKELLQSKKLAAIGTLASGVAHELNNPLNNIYLSSQMLEKEMEGCTSPAVREIVGDIAGQTKRMKQITGDLLEFARGREPHPRDVELGELVMEAYKLVSASMDTRRVHLHTDMDPEGILISADPEQMERVFINLFTNAVDAMSGEGTIKVRALKAQKEVRITVYDSGKGMTPETVEKIFEPFYTTRDKGTGLGLAIIFSIISKHNGEISVESKHGEGTTFTIVLPLRTDQQ
ncbi:MAG TPA: ATP-binding protein [Thermodesulfovibrionales bacterium]|nr:ATP-binding protein [Thermodesulfovibrionales bacterium]